MALCDNPPTGLACGRLALIAAATLGFLLAVAPGSARADCGYAGLVVSGTAEEVGDACRAVAAVLDHLAADGHAVQPAFRLVFATRVTVDMVGSGGTATAPAEVSGVYDHMLDEARVRSGRVRSDRTPWGLDWGPDIAYSILQHELTHAVMADLLGPDYARMGRACHEYAAYAVQFDLMEPTLRSRILSAHPDIEAFPGPQAVNGLLHAADPEGFGLRSYLFSLTPEGDRMLDDILGRRCDSDDATGMLWTH